jgi:FixJ family two-component response regulator
MQSFNRIRAVEASPPISQASPLISIVDDDQVVRESIADLIEALGYAAITFASAEEFLESAQIDGTACLITDLQMPGVDGLELQRRLAATGYTTPIIFITAFPKERARDSALQAGAVAFLVKPFEEASLINSIEAALALSAKGEGPGRSPAS